MTLVRFALRAHRVGFLAATGIACLNAILQATGYVQIAGETPEARIQFARTMELLGRQLSVMLPVPVQLETLAGFLQWRHAGNLPLVYGLWALLAGSGVGRGDEERGVVEQWLAAGVSRLRYLATRLVVFTAIATVSAALTLAATGLGARLVGVDLPSSGLAAQAIALVALALACFAIALVAAQMVTTRRAAGGLGGILLLVLFLLNGASRTVGDLVQVARPTPFSLYDRTRGLLTGELDVAATAALVAAATALSALATVAFLSRDLGGTVLRRIARDGPPERRPSRDPLLRVPVLALLTQQRVGLATWTVAGALLAVFFISLIPSMLELMRASPVMQAYFLRASSGDVHGTIVSALWSSTILFIVSIYVATQVATWASDDAEGRLEMLLAASVSRSRVVLERLGALVVATSAIVAAAAIAVALAAGAQDIRVDGWRLALAAAISVPLALAFGSMGAAVVAWAPRLALPLVVAVAVESYFVQQFGPLFQWPAWIQDLSLYSLYGNPLATGLEWGRLALLVALVAAATALALALMRRRQVAT